MAGKRESLPVSAVDMSPKFFRSQDFTLTTALMTTLNTAPTTLLVAPGAGLGYVVYWGMMRYVYGSAAFTGVQNPVVKYTNGAGTTLLTFTAAGYIDQTTGSQASVGGVVASGTQVKVVANAPLVLYNATGNMGGGTGCTVIIRLYYSIVPAI